MEGKMKYELGDILAEALRDRDVKERDDELATLRADNERLREALSNLLRLAKMHAPNAGFPQAEEALK
jgi:hypothetical protein